MTQTPTTAVHKDAQAQLRIIRPPQPKNTGPIPLCFNPTEYQITKANIFADVPIPGLETPLIQYIRGGSAMLSVEALVDTSDTLEDVRKRYVSQLRALMSINPKEHAPPVVAFEWGGTVFTGVVENLGITFVLFTLDGIPLRAKLALSLKEYRLAAAQVPTSSPTVEKSYLVRRGDTLASISNAMYRSPALWRQLALANGISDPRTLTPGQVLRVPALDPGVGQ
jgi:nucleoid-associated protein YgaU